MTTNFHIKLWLEHKGVVGGLSIWSELLSNEQHKLTQSHNPSIVKKANQYCKYQGEIENK